MRRADVGLACGIALLVAMIGRDLWALRAAPGAATHAAQVEGDPVSVAAPAEDGKRPAADARAATAPRGLFCANATCLATWAAGRAWTPEPVPECGVRVDWLE